MGPSDVLIVPGARSARAAALVCAVLVLGNGCGRHGPAAQNATSDTGLDDGSLTVAEGSPLRGKLKLETVEMRQVRSRLLTPASVEADPARMARIVPPLAGQVKQLFVRQGELVTKGQPLIVRSPLSGQVLSLATSPGEFRNDVTTPLLVVADLSSLWITASVPERDVQRVHVGDEALARVAAFPNQEFKGRILFIENVLETDTRSVKVRIQFDNTEGRLKPGMFATVSFLGAATPAIVLPTTALQVGETTYVWVERSPWTFVRRPVQLASENSESAVVTDGLKPGERVVVQNGALLQ